MNFALFTTVFFIKNCDSIVAMIFVQTDSLIAEYIISSVTFYEQKPNAVVLFITLGFYSSLKIKVG